MMRLLRRPRRYAELDARVADATAGAEQAAEEAAKSQQRYESVQRHVIRPLTEAAERNQFSAILRATLINEGDKS